MMLAPIIKRNMQFYTTLHVNSVDNIVNVAGNHPTVTVSGIENEAVLATADIVPAFVPEVIVPVPPAEAITVAHITVPADHVLSAEEHRELERSYLAENPDFAWIAPPRRLAADLRAHLFATSNNPTKRKDLSRLSPAVLASLANHGHISAGRKKWMKRLLRYAGSIGTRDFIPDGDELYDVLIRAHLGHSGRAHIAPSSMRKKLKEVYIFPPSERFYDAWVAACPGCLWSNS